MNWIWRCSFCSCLNEKVVKFFFIYWCVLYFLYYSSFSVNLFFLQLKLYCWVELTSLIYFQWIVSNLIFHFRTVIASALLLNHPFKMHFAEAGKRFEPPNATRKSKGHSCCCCCFCYWSPIQMQWSIACRFGLGSHQSVDGLLPPLYQPAIHPYGIRLVVVVVWWWWG